MGESRFFNSYPNHVKFELIAQAHPGYENWLWNHYTQLVFEPEEGLLNFASIDLGRCILIERIVQLIDIIEKDGINLGDYIRYYLAEGYWVSKAPDARDAKTWLPSFDDIWVCHWQESEGVFQCLRYTGDAGLEQCYVTEDELLPLIRNWECQVAFDKMRLGPSYSLNQNKIVKNIEYYLSSKPLPAPEEYYINQNEIAIYGIDACLGFVEYYQENSVCDDKEIREKIRASVCVLLEHKELMGKRLAVMQERTPSAGFAAMIQEYEIIRAELTEIAKALFARKAERWGIADRNLLYRIQELTKREQERFEQLCWSAGR